MNKIGFILVMWTALIVPSLGFSDTFGGRPALLVPEKVRSPVQLVDLSVEVTPSQLPKTWHVRAKVTIRNHLKRPHTARLVLPQRACDLENESCRSSRAGQFQRLSLKVNGVHTALKQGPMPTTDPNWELGKGVAHRVAIDLKKKDKATLHYEYFVEMSADREGDAINLFVGAPGHWWGPARRAYFRFVTLKRPWTVGYPRSMKLTDYRTRMSARPDRRPLTILEFRMKRWRPPTVISMHLGTAFEVGPAHRCPDLHSVVQAVRSGQKTLHKLLVMRSTEQIKRCAKVFLALYGFPFAKRFDRNAFYGRPVLSSSAKNTVTTGQRNYWRFGLQPNRDYTARLHPEDHRDYMKGLNQEFDRRSEEP